MLSQQILFLPIFHLEWLLRLHCSVIYSLLTLLYEFGTSSTIMRRKLALSVHEHASFFCLESNLMEFMLFQLLSPTDLVFWFSIFLGPCRSVCSPVFYLWYICQYLLANSFSVFVFFCFFLVPSWIFFCSHILQCYLNYLVRDFFRFPNLTISFTICWSLSVLSSLLIAFLRLRVGLCMYVISFWKNSVSFILYKIRISNFIHNNLKREKMQHK